MAIIKTGTKLNNTWVATAAAEAFDGLAGFDKVTYSTALAGLTIDLTSPELNTGNAEGDTFANVEFFGLTRFNDTFVGAGGKDNVNGGAGNDSLMGGANADDLSGHTGNDTIDGGEGNDVLRGGSNNDMIVGGASDDKLYGETYNDTLEGGDGNDLINGGAGRAGGIDLATYVHATSAVEVSLAIVVAQNTQGAGTDTLVGIENLEGSGFDDRLTGNSGANVLFGGAGNDTLSGGAGNDTLNGGEGSDVFTVTPGQGADRIADFFLGQDLINIASSWYDGNMANGEVVASGSGAGTLLRFTDSSPDGFVDNASILVQSLNMNDYSTSIFGDGAGLELNGDNNDNTLSGGASNDTINGFGGNDLLSGGDGNDYIDGGLGWDTINGGNGNDTIRGGQGNDFLTGGSGNDTFVFDEVGGTNDDRIMDFTAGAGTDDVIDLRGLGFTSFAQILTTGENFGSEGWVVGFVLGHSLLVMNVTEAQLSADDFLF